LVRNEDMVLAAALRLAVEGTLELYGYELFTRLTEWEGASPMNHGTLYRCLRRLQTRSMLRVVVSDSPSQGPARVCYQLTTTGVAEAKDATRRLAEATDTPVWVDPALLRRPIAPSIAGHVH
jgi:DNA-binding PadR family transcriptional regulator